MLFFCLGCTRNTGQQHRLRAHTCPLCSVFFFVLLLQGNGTSPLSFECTVERKKGPPCENEVRDSLAGILTCSTIKLIPHDFLFIFAPCRQKSAHPGRPHGMDQRIQDTIAMIDTSLSKDQQVSSRGGGGGEGSSGVSMVDVVCFLC